MASPIISSSDEEVSARPGAPPLLRSALSANPNVTARRIGADGEHLLLRFGHEEHQLWLLGPPTQDFAVAAVVPLDELMPQRAETALRFWRCLQNKPARRADRPPDARRTFSALRALDGHLGGASYRHIAESLFGEARVDADPWKTSSIRDATIRLVRSGVALMLGGYRKLLKK